jgi:hypothetical protein
MLRLIWLLLVTLISTPQKDVKLPLSVPSNAFSNSDLAAFIMDSLCEIIIISSEWMSRKMNNMLSGTFYPLMFVASQLVHFPYTH